MDVSYQTLKNKDFDTHTLEAFRLIEHFKDLGKAS